MNQNERGNFHYKRNCRTTAPLIGADIAFSSAGPSVRCNATQLRLYAKQCLAAPGLLSQVVSLLLYVHNRLQIVAKFGLDPCRRLNTPRSIAGAHPPSGEIDVDFDRADPVGGRIGQAKLQALRNFGCFG